MYVCGVCMCVSRHVSSADVCGGQGVDSGLFLLTVASYLYLSVGAFKQYLLTLSVTVYFGVTVVLETYTLGTLAWEQVHVQEFSPQVGVI